MEIHEYLCKWVQFRVGRKNCLGLVLATKDLSLVIRRNADGEFYTRKPCRVSVIA